MIAGQKIELRNNRVAVVRGRNQHGIEGVKRRYGNAEAEYVHQSMQNVTLHFVRLGSLFQCRLHVLSSPLSLTREKQRNHTEEHDDKEDAHRNRRAVAELETLERGIVEIFDHRGRGVSDNGLEHKLRLVKNLQSADDGSNQHVNQHRTNHRNGNLRDFLPGIRTVHLSRFKNVIGDGVDAGGKIDDVVAEVFPANSHTDYQLSQHTVIFKINGRTAQNLYHLINYAARIAEHRAKQQADGYRRYQIGEVIDIAEEEPPMHPFVAQHQREKKGNGQLRDNGNDPDDQGVSNALQEIAGGKQSLVIGQSDELGVSRKRVHLAEAQVDGIQNWVQAKYQKNYNKWYEKKVRILGTFL